MKKLFFLLLVIYSVEILAQTKYSTPSEEFISFHNNISSAERMYKHDSLLYAYAKFDIAFENYQGTINPGHYFRAALCAIFIKEEFKALAFLEKAITNGYEVDSAKRESIAFYNQNTKKEYLDNIAKWQTQGKAARNTSWEKELLATADANKKYTATNYKNAVDYCTSCLKNPKCSKTAPEYLSKYKLVKEKMKADSVTAVTLLNNIQKFGFPNSKLLSTKTSAIARTILLNNDADKKNERMDALLFKALNDGSLSPEFYATIIDRRNLMNGLSPEFYQPITGYEQTIGKDITVANNKRKTIGLYPIVLVITAKPKDPKAAVNKPYENLYDY